jgi:hypothetical protein
MHGEICHTCSAWSIILIGIIVILARYINWDIWTVLGIILVIKGLASISHPVCPHDKAKPAAKKKK